MLESIAVAATPLGVAAYMVISQFVLAMPDICATHLGDDFDLRLAKMNSCAASAIRRKEGGIYTLFAYITVTTHVHPVCSITHLESSTGHFL